MTYNTERYSHTKEEFPTKQSTSSSSVSSFVQGFYNLIPWSSAPSATSPEKETQQHLSKHSQYIQGLWEIWQKGFICLDQATRHLIFVHRIRHEGLEAEIRKKQTRGLSALFYWLLDSWLAPLWRVHRLKEDGAKHCCSAYRLSRGIKGYSKVHRITSTLQIHSKPYPATLETPTRWCASRPYRCQYPWIKPYCRESYSKFTTEWQTK